MRNEFCGALTQACGQGDFVFLTGDLGFKALEPLRDAAKDRFINAGVAEQNMVSVAAGLAKAGLRPWVYSIAPFVYARPFEQIRNDVCLHNLPVMLVGNGGGYGYGVMGATHHALEDYGVLLTLQHLCAFIPAFNSDVGPVVRILLEHNGPAYLRLGYGEEPKDRELPEYQPWRKLSSGMGPVLLAIGPLAGAMLDHIADMEPSCRPSLWVLCELPIKEIPEGFLRDLAASDRLLVIEEHVAAGGVAQALAQRLLETGRAPRHFRSRCALGYPSKLYGSQRFHRRECGLDPESLMQELAELSRLS